MTTHQCDRCRQELERGTAVVVGRGYFSGDVVLCDACARPILAYLENEQLSLRPPLVLSRGDPMSQHSTTRRNPAVEVVGVGTVQTSDESVLAHDTGTLKGAWTSGGEDAADYARRLRNDMQPKRPQ